ncbi:MAG: guanylate kinase [Patescibacteria group bacterium]
MKKRPGKLFIISGTSQVGKSTVARALVRLPSLSLKRIITTTTRPRRLEDKLATYHFCTVNEFKKLIKQDKLLEWARVHNYYYGTPRQPVEHALKQGSNVVLVIDVQGSQQLRKRYPKTVTIFITAESKAEIKRRIFQSSHIPDQQKNKRWHTTQHELKQMKNYDYIVVNHWGKLNQTVNRVAAIIRRHITKGLTKR